MLDETKSRDDDPLKASRTRAADTCDDAAGGIRLVAPADRFVHQAGCGARYSTVSTALFLPPRSLVLPFPRPSPATAYSYAERQERPVFGCPTRRLDRPPFGIARRPDGRQQDSMDRIDREDEDSSVHID